MKIIDMHTHVFPQYVRLAVEVMDRCGIESSVTLEWHDGFGDCLRRHLDIFNAYPGRFTVFGNVDFKQINEPGLRREGRPPDGKGRRRRHAGPEDLQGPGPGLQAPRRHVLADRRPAARPDLGRRRRARHPDPDPHRRPDLLLGAGQRPELLERRALRRVRLVDLLPQGLPLPRGTARRAQQRHRPPPQDDLHRPARRQQERLPRLGRRRPRRLPQPLLRHLRPHPHHGQERPLGRGTRASS